MGMSSFEYLWSYLPPKPLAWLVRGHKNLNQKRHEIFMVFLRKSISRQHAGRTTHARREQGPGKLKASANPTSKQIKSQKGGRFLIPIVHTTWVF
jgi:hypothetical protein